jgi:hypothetical protein
MSEEDDILTGALELSTAHWRREQDVDRTLEERAERSRMLADEVRLALAELAMPAVTLIAARLAGVELDDNKKPITDEREDTAWEILSRVGVPRLRATAIAASISAAPNAPAPDSPGWVPPQLDDGDGEQKELDPASYDAQIESFLAGADAKRKLDGDR